MKKVVLYGRISKDRENETSTETQEREMREYCAIHNLDPVAIFIDYGKSAFKLEERAEFEKAMSMIENGHAEMLVVWKLDRMMRNARQWVKENARLEKVGASFASVKEQWFDTSTPIGFALVVLMAALAEMEAEAIQTRALGWHSGRLLRGEIPTGTRPYGYNRDTPNTLTVNEDEAKVIEWLAESIMKGDPLRGLAKQLDEKGIPTSNGGKWCHTTIRQIVLSPTVAAKRKLKDGTYVDSDKWDAIITEKQWNHIQTLLNDPTRATLESGKHSRKLKYMLPSLLTCGKCGDKMKTASHVTGTRYECQSCSGMSIKQDVADKFVSEILLSLIDDEAWTALRARGKKTDPAAMERLTAMLNHEREKWLDGIITDAEWDTTQTQIKSRALKLEQADAVEIPNVESLKDSWEGLNVNDKRLVITAVTKKITCLPYQKGQTGTKRIVIDMA